MMKYCLVNESGEPVTVIYPSRQDMYVEGRRYGGLTARAISSDLEDAYVLERMYWKYGGTRVRAPAPAPHYRWDLHSENWVRDLKEERKVRISELKSARDTAEFSPFTYNDMTFDGDLDAQRRLSVLVSAAKSAIAAGYSFTKDFTLADNTVVQLTAEDFIGIEMAKLWQVDVAFQEYRLKKAAIEAATTIEELEAFTI